MFIIRGEKMNDNIEELVHQEKLKYYKEWRKNNKDKVQQHNQNFWLKKVKQRGKNNGKTRNF